LRGLFFALFQAFSPFTSAPNAPPSRTVFSTFFSALFNPAQSAGSPAWRGIEQGQPGCAQDPGLHDPPLSCYDVHRFNSNSPSFAFNSIVSRLGLGTLQATGLNSFYTRRLVGHVASHRDKSPAFFVSSLSAAQADPGLVSVLMHLPPFHGHAGATVSSNSNECTFATILARHGRFFSVPNGVDGCHMAIDHRLATEPSASFSRNCTLRQPWRIAHAFQPQSLEYQP
jgi:hypothetical protein